MIRFAILTVATAALATPLMAQELPLTEEAKAEAITALAKRGLNCPVLKGIVDEGENALGKIRRIKCQSNNGKQSWDLRMITPPRGLVRIEPW